MTRTAITERSSASYTPGVAIYLRISQDREGLELGVTRQREDCLKISGPDPVEYRDNDISASKRQLRPGYVQMMAAVSRGEVSRIVTYSTSRLWRNRVERASAIELLMKHSVSIVPVKGATLDLSSASGRMVAGIMGEVDTHEADQISERIKREVLQRAELGKNHGGPKMFGVSSDGVSLIEDEAEKVREWYQQFLAGASLMGLARTAGKRHGSMRALLLNPRNAGLRILHGETFKASNPALVSETTWRAAKSILEDPKRKTSPGTAYRWFGAGVFVCHECQKPVRTHARKYRTYRCEECGRSWRADRVEQYVTEVVAGWLRKYSRSTKRTGVRQTDLGTEAAAIRIRLEQLGEAFGSDSNVIEFVSATKSLRSQLAEIEERQAQVGNPGALSSLGYGDEAAEKFLKLKDPQRKAAIVSSIVSIELKPYVGERKNWKGLVGFKWKNPG